MVERDLLDKLEIKKTGKNTYEVRDLETGEILGKDNPRLDLAIDEYEKIIKFNKANKKAVKKVQGKVDLSETHHLDWKKKSHFIKIYRTEIREYKKQVRLSENASAILFYLQDYIEYKTNKVLNSNGEGFSNSDIHELTGVSERSIGRSLKELEDKWFIKRLGRTNQREIYVNPYLYCAGNIVSKDTIKLFSGYSSNTQY